MGARLAGARLARRIDNGEATYDELLAWGERIGTVSRGLNAGEIKTCTSQYVWPDGTGLDCRGSEACGEEGCAVCLAEYNDGEKVRLLRCRHLFHSACIDRWLAMSRRCPVCQADVRDIPPPPPLPESPSPPSPVRVTPGAAGADARGAPPGPPAPSDAGC